MRQWLASATILGSAILLSGCVYYPDGPAGPGYGPPPPHTGYATPPPSDYGPPPGGDESGPPPGDEAGGPPPDMSGGATMAPPPRPHGPKWCAKHPHRCARHQQMMNEDGGPPPGADQGPPPGEDDQPPPQQ